MCLIILDLTVANRFIRWVQYVINRGRLALPESDNTRGPFQLPSSQFSRWNSTDPTQVSQRRLPQAQSLPTQSLPAQSPQERRRATPKGKIVLDIGLPMDYGPSLPKRISVTISDDMDVEELNYILSKKFGVNGNRWKLIVVSDEDNPRILDRKSGLKNFQFNKKERLYFYPEIRVR
jgi:hypothetical protein